MSRILVSYRAQDSGGLIGRLVTELRTTFGEDEVQSGLADLVPYGGDKHEALSRAVQQAAALIVFVGPGWTADEAQDEERIALAAAIREGRRVIPLLVDGGTLPEALPAELEALHNLTPAEFALESYSNYTPRIIAAIEKSLPRVATPELALGGGVSTEGTFTSPAESGGALFINAITYTFSTDKNWIVKTIIAGVLAVFIPIIGQIIVTGYGVRITRRILDEQAGLPEWDDWGGDITRGAMVFIGQWIYSLVFSVIIMVPFFCMMTLAGSSDSSFLFLVCCCALFLLMIPLSYVFIVAFVTATARYVQTEQFSEYFNFSAIMAEMTNWSRNIMFVVQVWLYGFVMSFVLSFAFALCFLPGIPVMGVLFFGYFYLLAYWVMTLNPDAKGKRKPAES